MKSLLWKDFRQNRRVVLAVAIIAAIPYVAALAITALQKLFESPSDSWANAVMGAGWVSLNLSVLLAAFIGGSAIAGERADRSAEFAAGLPIPRRKTVASKATVSSVSCLAIWATNVAIVGIAFWATGYDPSGPLKRTDVAVGMATACLSCTLWLFGLSWLYSSMLSSPAISAAAAIGTAIGLFLLAQQITDHSFQIGGYNEDWDICVYVAAPLIGLLSLAAGATICLRRVEP